MNSNDIADAAVAIVQADKDATHALARHRDHPAVRIVGWAAELGDQPPLIALAVGTVVVGWAMRRGDLVRGGARMLAAHLAATSAKTLIKNAVERARPRHALETGDERFAAGDSTDHELTSFPSGHTAGAVAVARAASRDIDGVAAPAALATVAIAAAQAPSGHHYLLDVIAGAAIGWVAEALVSAAFDEIERAVVERYAPGATSPFPHRG